MSSATLARRAAQQEAPVPADEVIGSMTRERIALLVRATGQRYLEDGGSPAKHWLAHMLDTEIPYGAYDQLCGAYSQAARVDNCDLEFEFDVPNTDANREAMQRACEQTIDFCVDRLTVLLCTQLGVSA